MGLMSNLEEQCVRAGLKLTAPRKVILKVLQEAQDHPSVETLYDRARSVDPTISMATVYRTLNLLDELGLVMRHEFKENFSRYEINIENHYHLIDTDQGKVVEFHNDELKELMKKIARANGYELLDHRLEIYGRKILKTKN